ncbi:uncharacterized protein [Amphiura filiformis]|uniref:uncharacterized protein n=1 Tax=Amphiura filiformis TaxID=82378 RepID=UPI003B215930
MCTECYWSRLATFVGFCSRHFRRLQYHKIKPTDIMADQPTSITAELTKCGLCNETVTNPKSLPCLHVFCLSCLRQWTSTSEDKAGTAHSEEFLCCPVCKSTTAMPSGDGLEGLSDNVFIASMAERSQKTIPGKDAACICCEGTSTVLLARCLNCDGFLCKKGIQLHQRIKLLRNHQIYKLADLQSGKVDVNVFADEKHLMCKKHKAQVLWFFCETCNVLICRDCTVVSHSSPDHVYVELNIAALKQKQQIQRLLEESSATALRIKDALSVTRSTQGHLNKNAEQVGFDIEKAAEIIISHVHKVYSDEKNRIQEHVTAVESKFGAVERRLLSEQAQLKRAQEVATQLLNEGSDFDVTSIYQQLMNSFQNSSFVEKELEEGLCCINFNRDSDIGSNIQRLGTLTLGVAKVSQGTWILDRNFGREDPGMLKCPSGIAVTSCGNIVIANSDPDTPVHIYGTDATYKFSLDKRSKKATDVTFAPSSDEIFVTTEKKKYVSVYDAGGRYLRKFSTLPPGDDVKVPDVVMLRGLAFRRSAEQVLVGEESRKYISVHYTDGSHVKSFYVLVTPYFLAVTKDDYIVMSPREEKVGSTSSISMATSCVPLTLFSIRNWNRGIRLVCVSVLATKFVSQILARRVKVSIASLHRVSF